MKIAHAVIGGNLSAEALQCRMFAAWHIVRLRNGPGIITIAKSKIIFSPVEGVVGTVIYRKKRNTTH